MKNDLCQEMSYTQFASIDLSVAREPRPAMLAIKNLVKTYENGHPAVKGVSLEIAKGEFIVLVGPSGCGKSSILRTIAGLESLSAGEIHLAGRRVDKSKPALRDIAMVFQNYALYPHMTVYDNLAYGLKNRGVDKSTIQQKIANVAHTLKIADYLDRKPAKLSGGQRQRVAMGRAMVRDPQLFLFDEPLSNLDAALRAHMRLEIKKLQRELGVTSIYVTHDQVEAMTLADRIVVLNQGEIEQVGTPAQVYHQPATRFVASFMGSPAMNFLPARLEHGVLSVGDTQIFLAAYQTLEAQEITLGIRPEHLSWQSSPQTLTLTMQVSIVEPLGPNQLVHGEVAKQRFIAITPEMALDSAALTLHVAYPHLHLFDRHGERLVAVHHTPKSPAKQR